MKRNKERSVLLRSLNLSFSMSRSQFVLVLSAGVLNCLVGVAALFSINELFSLIEASYNTRVISSEIYLLTVAYSAMILMSAVYTVYYKRYYVQFRGITAFEKNIRALLHVKCNSISNEQLEIPRVDQYMRQARNASMNIYRLTEIYLRIFVAIFSAVVTCLYVSTFNIWYSLFFLLAVIPPVIEVFFGSKLWKKYYERLAELSREEALYRDAICSIDVAKENKINGANGILFDKWQQTRKKIVNIENRKLRSMFLLRCALLLFQVIGNNGGFVISAILLFYGKVNVGAFTAGIAAYATLKANFTEVFDLFGSLRQFSLLVKPFFMYLDFPERKPLQEQQYSFTKQIQLNDVSFSYANSSAPAVSNVNLEIRKGEKIAIVGENGAGKTTLLNIILGNYVASSGVVAYDGIDVANISEKTLYTDKSAVRQKFNKYVGLSFAENICLDSLFDEDKMSQITKAVGIEQFASDLSLGREFGGKELSGGEWQKVACARGLYKSFDLIALDEPTSAIDPLRESALYDVFEQYSKGKTAIIVTHRMGAARLADRIVVMRKGKIVEMGTHAELMAKNGFYTKIYNSQYELLK